MGLLLWLLIDWGMVMVDVVAALGRYIVVTTDINIPKQDLNH